MSCLTNGALTLFISADAHIGRRKGIVLLHSVPVLLRQQRSGLRTSTHDRSCGEADVTASDRLFEKLCVYPSSYKRRFVPLESGRLGVGVQGFEGLAVRTRRGALEANSVGSLALKTTVR